MFFKDFELCFSKISKKNFSKEIKILPTRMHLRQKHLSPAVFKPAPLKHAQLALIKYSLYEIEAILYYFSLKLYFCLFLAWFVFVFASSLNALGLDIVKACCTRFEGVGGEAQMFVAQMHPSLWKLKLLTQLHFKHFSRMISWQFHLGNGLRVKTKLAHFNMNNG